MADVRKLKDRAAGLIAKGKWAKAADVLSEVIRAEPRDIVSRQKLAEALRRAGDEEAAVRVYREVADRYAANGQLIKAVAINKLILEIDPNHEAMQATLANLYARRGAAAVPESKPGETATGESNTGATLPPLPLEKLEFQPLAAEVASPIVRFGDGSFDSPYEQIVATAREATAAGVLDPVTLEIDVDFEEDASHITPPAAEDLVRVELARIAVSQIEVPEAAGNAVDGSPPVTTGTELWAAERTPAVRLPRIPIFSDLSHAAFVDLARRLTLHRVAEGEVILRQGEVGTSFFVIAAGRVRVEKNTPGGRLVLAHLGEGAFFGEMALLSGAQRVASVVAEEPCELLEIRAEVLEDLTRAHPHVAASLTKFYRQRLLANVLATNPLFRPFGREDRVALMQRFRTREIWPGDALVREGEPSDGLYVVLSGEVDVTRRRDGTEVLLARLAEGDVFGEASCLRKEPANATVSVRRRATLLWLPRAVFDEVVVAYPPVLELVAELADQREHAPEGALTAKRNDGDDGPILV